MTQHQASTPPGGGTAQEAFDPGRLKDAPLRMRRSRTDRKIAGVCGGFAQYARIDPVVVRVVVAALTVVGGVGLVLYVAGWLLVPEEGSEVAVVDRHQRRRPDDVRWVGWLVAAAVALVAVLGSGPWFGPGAWWGGWPLWPLLLLLAVGWFVFARGDRALPPLAEHESPDVAAAGGPGAAPTGAPGSAPVATPVGASVGAPLSAPVGAPVGSPMGGTGGPPVGGPGGPPVGGPWAGAVPPAAPARRRPSRGGGALTAVTAGLALVAVGVLWLVEQAGTELEPSSYAAVVVAVIGLGALIGTWVGNGRPLVPLGVMATIVLVASTQVPVWSAGEVNDTPTRAAQVPAAYEQGAGRIRLDLTEVQDLAQLDGHTLSLDIGAGDVDVLVPDGLGVVVAADLLVGDLRVLDRESTGFDNELRVRDVDPGDPVLVLDVVGSAGQIEVTRP